MIEIQIDKSQLADVKAALSGVKNGAEKVMARAINKTLTGVRTDATREIGNILNLKAGYIRNTFTINKSYVDTAGRVVTASVKSKGKPVGLIHFTGTKENLAGVSVKVRKDKPRKTIAHAFIETAKTAENVFRREYKGPRKPVRDIPYASMPRRYRYPIDRLTGPRVQDIYDDPPVIGAVIDKAGGRLDTNLDRELNYELSKLK